MSIPPAASTVFYPRTAGSSGLRPRGRRAAHHVTFSRGDPDPLEANLGCWVGVIRCEMPPLPPPHWENVKNYFLLAWVMTEGPF